jgi:hypothetical protein
MSDQIAVLIDAKLHNEIVLRLRKPDDVSHIIANVVADFLERTKHDDDLWSDEFIEEIAAMESDDRVATYGDATKGYQWQALFLPNGTLLKITYKGRDHLADIRHEHLTHDGRRFTPSEWASRVANNTSRNAWRDISVQLPGSSRWELADVLRHKQREGR